MKKLFIYLSLGFSLINIKGNAQCSSSNSVSTNSLALHLPFINGSGTDASGNNLNATMVLTSATGNHNSTGNDAVSLMGGFNSGGTIAHSSSLDFTNQITIATWIKPNNFTGVQRIIDKINGSVTGNFLLDMNGATLRFFVASGSLQYAITGVSTNTWFHVAATYNGTVTSIYINGVLKNSTSAVTGNLVTNTSPLKIGLDQTGANPFAGAIDDIKIYGRGLSATEVLDLYQTPEFNAQPPTTVNMCSSNTSITGSAICTGTVATYKWKKGTSYLSDNVTYSGTATNTLTIINGGAPETGTYQLEAFSPNCISTLSQSVTVNMASLATLNNTGLILNYPFNNQLGNDVSGNNLDAALVGTYGTGADQNNASNSALVFSNAKTLTSHNNLMNVTNQLALSCWFNASIISASSSIAHRLVDKFNGGTSGNFVLDINANRIRFFCGSALATSASTVSINTWYHVAATYDGANLKIYLNGVLDQTVPYTGNLTPNTSAFTVGKDQSNTSDFFGSMSDVRFYSRAISQQEVMDIMQAADVIASPRSSQLCLGQNAILKAYASANDIVWRKNGVVLTDGGNISGSSTPTLTIANLAVSDYDSYSCEAIHNCVVSTPCTFTITQRNQVSVPNDNLIFYYACNNTIGNDFSGNNLNMASATGITAANDKDNIPNKAIFFNASTAYATVNSSPLMYSNGNATTFAMWIMPATTGSQRIIEKNSSYYVDVNAGVYRFILNTGSVFNTTVAPATGVWQHLAFTYDGTMMKFFYNGVLTNTLSAPSISLAPNNNPVYIGSTNTTSLKFYGSLDEVKFYKRALSDQEIYGLFVAPSIQQQIGSSLACNTGSVALDATAFSPEAVSYQWYYNGNTVSGQTSSTLNIASLNGSNTGTYVCNYSNACSIIPTDTAVVQLLAPSTVSVTINPTVSCPGMPVTLTASSPTVSSYVWSIPAGPVNYTSVFTPTMGAVGSVYSYSLSVSSGTCTVQTVTSLTVSACTGIQEDLLLGGISVCPNPVTDLLTIQLDNFNTELNANIQGIDGRVVKTIRIVSGESRVSLADLSEGIYFITIGSGGRGNTYKIIKQ